jgi:hypothetical protein
MGLEVRAARAPGSEAGAAARVGSGVGGGDGRQREAESGAVTATTEERAIMALR